MKRLLRLLMPALCAMSGLSSCVHELPEPPENRTAVVTVHHELPWNLFDYYVSTRSDGDPASAVRYIYEIYPAGSTEQPVSRYVEMRSDMTLADFTTTLPIPAGDYDVYVWSDFAEPYSELSPYYDASTLDNIKVRTPYRGNTSLKDAFQGMFSVSVPYSIDETVSTSAEVTLCRPLTSYAFLSTDLHEFIEQETRRLGMAPVEEDVAQIPQAVDFSKYKARMIYTGFLPVEYNLFRNRPVDSATGICYEGGLKVVNNDEVLIGFDYILINGAASTINVAIQIFDADDRLVSEVPTLTLPVERNRATIVRGDFLTSHAQGGIGINPDFDGQFNIEIN